MAKAFTIAVVGDVTTTGGVIVDGASTVRCDGKLVALVGSKATCPKCKKGWGNICRNTMYHVKADNEFVALGKYVIDCGCPTGTNRVVTPAGRFSFVGHDDGMVEFDGVQLMQSISNADGTPIDIQSMMGSVANVAGQQAYDFTKKEWNKDLQDDLKEYLEGRHTQVCILSVDDAAKCALNIWHQKNKDGETIGSETLKLLDDIHSKIDMGVGFIAAAKISKALGNFGITVKQYIDAKGIERVIISSLWNDPKKFYAVVNGLNIKKNHPYRVTNPTIKQLGVLAEDTMNGFKKGAVLSLIVSATINTNELVFNDDYHLVDWCGSMGSDLFKLLAEGAVVGGIVYLTVAFGVAMPILVGAMIWVGVDIIISKYWDEHKVEDNIINSLKEVTNAK
ncbi:PAAR domain-containing protein [Vibrio parahaemolyticus]|nr:PAAR domain-containing protein [Vibrio parahaemolyticus]